MTRERRSPRSKPGGTDATAITSNSSLTCDVRDCRICGEAHDEVITLLWEPVIRRIEDGDLTAELIYVQRELLDDDPDEKWRTSLIHRLALIKGEISRRRRHAAKGGPIYKAQTSISRERIAAVKQIDISEVVGRDLPIAWMRRNRTYFYCDAHGDGRDRKPSLVSYDDQGRWHCFGCNQGGTAIDWMIARHGLDFRRAIEELERWAA